MTCWFQKTNYIRFVDYFRLSKEAFKFVLEKIVPSMKVAKRTTIISNKIKLATTLRFLAQGSYQVGVGNDFNLALSQPTLSAILAETLEALEKVICPLLIKFEMSEEEQTEAKRHFFQKAGFPGVIGCVDGTHIKISAPTKLDQNLYFNRKGFFSLNTIIICDHKMKISYFDARYAGSSHDSLIWNISSAKQVLRERYDSGVRNAWLLGDAGYPLEPYLMTPYRSSSEGSAEALLFPLLAMTAWLPLGMAVSNLAALTFFIYSAQQGEQIAPNIIDNIT
ncbi:putative nuclease HARBI1 [Eurosta solidaginis]|uniref:putative nuclease HARBI1 n=1 Tax=Eurosta solidaginis TaxID=178769 RepID=UPI003531437C